MQLADPKSTNSVPKSLPILDMARLRIIRSRLTGTLAMGLQLESGWSQSPPSPDCLPEAPGFAVRRIPLGQPALPRSPVERPRANRLLPQAAVPTWPPRAERFSALPRETFTSNRPPRYNTHTATTQHEAQPLSASGKASGTYESSSQEGPASATAPFPFHVAMRAADTTQRSTLPERPAMALPLSWPTGLSG